MIPPPHSPFLGRAPELLTQQDTAMLVWSYVTLEEGLLSRTHLWDALMLHNVGRWHHFSIHALSIVAW